MSGGQIISQGYQLWVAYHVPRDTASPDDLRACAEQTDDDLRTGVGGPHPVVAWEVRSGHVPTHLNAHNGEEDGTPCYDVTAEDAVRHAVARATVERDLARRECAHRGIPHEVEKSPAGETE